jgi:membrane-associated phospholipid phosphatase
MAVAWTIDIPVAAYFRLDIHPEFFHELVSFAEVFGHGLGVAWILLTVYVLDVHQRHRLPRIVAAIIAAGMSTNLAKLAVGRIRPRELAVDRVWDSFAGWFPGFHSEIPLGLTSGDCQSMPSGHAAVATALAIGLSILYPRGRWLFACFAVLASMQRIETCAHYLSDTLAGAALACLIWAAFLDRRGLGRGFERWEANRTETTERTTERRQPL